MARVKKFAPVQVRNIKTEKPLGISWDEAVDLLVQGYSPEHVAKKTGFPAKMLERELRAS